mmetsp:Transcript_14460/g.32931  ORF Transcript_14460/g.32931 Transcript_14460/m.32931 type:complete len:1673 (+) Transcript_14460:2-5020(+)
MLVRCSEQTGGCGGGHGHLAYQDLMEFGGVWSDDCLPYQGESNKHCPAFASSWSHDRAAGETGKMGRVDQEILKGCNDTTRYTNRPPVGKEWDPLFDVAFRERFGNGTQAEERAARFRRSFEKARSRDNVAAFQVYDQEAIKAALAKYGALYIAYTITEDWKKGHCKTGCWTPSTVWGYDNGQHESTCTEPTAHAVQVVGYGTEIDGTGQRTPYWLLENSWGYKHGSMDGVWETAGLWGADPFKSAEPGDCVLAGWAGLEIQSADRDVPVTNGPADGFNMTIKVAGHVVATVSVESEFTAFRTLVNITPGNNTVTFEVSAGNHPKARGFDIEHFLLRATSVQCKGRGFLYSFTRNDTKAVVRFNRRTRQELKSEAQQMLVDHGVDLATRWKSCPEECRTGSFSEPQPCEDYLSTWRKCYEWETMRLYSASVRLANCTLCDGKAQMQEEAAVVRRSFSDAEYSEWYALMEEAFTAPDMPGYARTTASSCDIQTAGWTSNVTMSATYTFYLHDGADENRGCDERHQAMFDDGHWVNAPGSMGNGATTSVRCPMPLAGEVSLLCEDGMLSATSHTCTRRLQPLHKPTRKISDYCRALDPTQCAEKEQCSWSFNSCEASTSGYFKILRGVNYHGIEASVTYAIAEMSTLAGHCATNGWTRWSACSVTEPCQSGTQNRTRTPVLGVDPDSPECTDVSFFESRPCVGSGFCSQILTRMSTGSPVSPPDFLANFKSKSMRLSAFSTSAAHALPAQQSCEDIRYWCNIATGQDHCAMMSEGYFQIKQTGQYIIDFQPRSGYGEMWFRGPDQGHYRVTQDGLYDWQDTGFHHRRRRTGHMPWVHARSVKLNRGYYFAQWTRVGWTDCPDEQYVLRDATSIFAPATVLSGAAAAGEGMVNGAAVPATFYYPEDIGPFRYGGTSKWQASPGGPAEVVLSGWKFPERRVAIDKLDYSGTELYNLFGVAPENMTALGCSGSFHHRLTVMAHVVIPTAGTNIIRFMGDFTIPDAWAPSWGKGFDLVVGAGNETYHAFGQASERSTDALIEIRYVTEGPSIVPLKVVMDLQSSQTDCPLMPFSFSIETRAFNPEMEGPLALGSLSHEVPQFTALHGDADVRITWPDRDDPMVSELQVQSFKPIPDQGVLIGREARAGFLAKTNGRVDAGACLTLEAWVPNATSGFQGLAAELCDLDGQNQYLQLAVLSNGSRLPLGWVHAEFLHPMHIRIIRSPDDLTNFQVSYRPDNREEYATPFGSAGVARLTEGYTGPLEIGVSMTTPDSYRQAQFYDVVVEDCPDSCDVAGDQEFCGEVATACGTTLQCSEECTGGRHCHLNQCVTCPVSPVPVPNACAATSTTCETTAGEKVAVPGVVAIAPGPNYECVEGFWQCVPKTKVSAVADGLECGLIDDGCGGKVELYNCYRENDVCEDNICVCHPSVLDPSYNCGKHHDGCGTAIIFGPHGGQCDDAEQVCTPSFQCCTRNPRSNLQCGRGSDGCEGEHFYFMQDRVLNFVFNSIHSWKGMKDAPGELGAGFKLEKDLLITALARGVRETLEKSCVLTLWDASTQKVLRRTVAIAGTPDDNGFAWAELEEPLFVRADTTIVISFDFTSTIESGGTRSGSAYAGRRFTKTDFASLVGWSRYSAQVGKFPEEDYWSGDGPYGTTNFRFAINDGCGEASTCSDNKCEP